MADPENQETPAKSEGQQPSDGIDGWDIGLNMAYITSIPGILKIVEFFTLMIAFALAADTTEGDWTWGRRDFFLFVTITSWIVVLVLFFLFAFNVIAQINLNIDWNILVLVFAAIAALLLLICSSLIADDARKSKGAFFPSFIEKLRAAAMDSETPAQLPVVQEAQPSAVGQPIMFQMQPGQQQPVFIQVPAGHPATTPEGQPLQYFYIPVNQGAPGKPVESGQSVYIQGVHGEPVQQQPACPGGFDLNIDTGFLKSPLCFIKIAEFVSLLSAWASILKYLDGVMAPDLEHDANFFKGIMIFSWVVVIVYLITYILSLPKTVCKCNRPSLFTITSVFFYFILFVLLLACTGNLVPKAVALGEEYRKLSSKSKISQYIVALDVALAFGFLSCILFVVDMVLNYREFQTQRAQETSPDQGQQGPPQRRVWDINYEYLHSPLFNIKLSEVSLLLGAWVCILRYFGTGSLTLSTGTSFISVPMEDSKADFFRGITVFAWVMVILLTLTFIFSFEKICSRSSPWTLLTLLFYFFLSILLIACCGNLTSRAVDLGKIYKTLGTESTSKALALFIGLGFGYFSWIIFLVDIYLIFKLYRQQRAQEFPYQQPAGQPVLQQPPVVIVAQGAGKQQFYQPVAHPGQQPSQYPGQQSSQYPGQQPYQYPGQQPVVIGAPTAPPPYSQNHPPPEPN